MPNLVDQIEALLEERDSDWALDYGQVDVTDEGNSASALVMKVRGEHEARRWVVVNLDEDKVIDIHI